MKQLALLVFLSVLWLFPGTGEAQNVCGPNLGCFIPASTWYPTTDAGEGYTWDVSKIRDCWTNAWGCSGSNFVHNVTYCLPDKGIRFGVLSRFDLNVWTPPSRAIRVMIWDDCPPATGESEPTHVPDLPYLRVWSVYGGEYVIWVWGESEYVGLTYIQTMPRESDPQHPYAVLILAAHQDESVLDYISATINGQRVGVWIEYVDTNGNVTKVVQYE